MTGRPASRPRRARSILPSRGANVHHEVSPLAGVEVFALFTARLHARRTLERDVPADRSRRRPRWRRSIHRAGPGVGIDETEMFASVSARGWSECRRSGHSSKESRGCRGPEGPLLSRRDGWRPHRHRRDERVDGVALMAGASTVPEGRRQGAQLALLDARFRFAAYQGCDVAMMCASPGSASQRNAERHGFRIAYTRTKWQLSR